MKYVKFSLNPDRFSGFVALRPLHCTENPLLVILLRFSSRGFTEKKIYEPRKFWNLSKMFRFESFPLDIEKWLDSLSEHATLTSWLIQIISTKFNATFTSAIAIESVPLATN